MTAIMVPVPPTLNAHRGALREFFAGMVRKLDLNSHKDVPGRQDVEMLLAGALREIAEFLEQYHSDKFDENTLVETFDSANFIYLTYMALRNGGTKTKLENYIDEFCEIDVKQGKVFCRKTGGPGSQHRVGDEMGGNPKKGYVILKFQTTRTSHGASAISRSHVVWWKGTGRWPAGVIDHINGDKTDDRLENLRDVSVRENNLNTVQSKRRTSPPYVKQYKPKGLEHRPKYGKWVYGRAYDGKLINVGYFDTPEEALTTGGARWLEKVKEYAQNKD